MDWNKFADVLEEQASEHIKMGRYDVAHMLMALVLAIRAATQKTEG